MAVYLKIDWDDINYLLEEVEDWKIDDADRADQCYEMMGHYTKPLIERIQKLARENAELRAEKDREVIKSDDQDALNELFKKVLNKFPYQPTEFNYPPIYDQTKFPLKQDYKWMPPYLISCESAVKAITDTNSTYRDSM